MIFSYIKENPDATVPEETFIWSVHRKTKDLGVGYASSYTEAEQAIIEFREERGI